MLSLNRVRKAHKQERFPQSAEFKYIYWPTAPGQLQQQVWEGCAGGGAQLVELPACPALAGAAMKHGGAGRVEGEHQLAQGLRASHTGQHGVWTPDSRSPHTSISKTMCLKEKLLLSAQHLGELRGRLHWDK